MGQKALLTLAALFPDAKVWPRLFTQLFHFDWCGKEMEDQRGGL